MDLSHWDLINDFTMREAACLAGGIEPLLYRELATDKTAKAQIIHRTIARAYETAVTAAHWVLTERKRALSETLESVFLAFPSHVALPSNQLLRVVRNCLYSGREFDNGPFSSYDENSQITFSRERLGGWFSLKGFKPIYSFVPTPEEGGREKQREIQSPSREHVSNKLALMNQAAATFWTNADRGYRGSHPDNATVAVWLVQRGFSQTLADKAATIIRPDWVPTGRKPDE